MNFRSSLSNPLGAGQCGELLRSARVLHRLRRPIRSAKRALKADNDDAAWASLYRTVSRPFPTPRTGKVAVKVINHYGDEVMKVYSVDGDQH